MPKGVPKLPKIPKASSNAAPSSEPLNTYTLKPIPGWTQFEYDRVAFANPRKLGLSQGCPLRTDLFWKIADHYLPGHFERHAWTDKVIETLCNNPLAGMPGCCVRGDTRILNPITGESPTIKELCDSKTEPIVMTLDGPAQASVPFLKGREELFEVQVANGARFVATAGHRVLLSARNDESWSAVGDLRIGQRLRSYIVVPANEFLYRESRSPVISITPIGSEDYYDLSVPGPEHYFAEGCIHHNSSAGKTYNVVGFAVVWWLADPTCSSVQLVSTTRDSLKKRGWAEVQKCFSKLAHPKIGNFVDSKMLWQSKKAVSGISAGDDRHAIYGKAVEEGSVTKVADDLKGIHTKRQMVIIDEATSVPGAIYEAVANLYSYPIQANGEFIMVLLGNPLNRMDQFGRFCEPEGGWNTVTVDSGEWLAKRQIEIGGLRPKIVTFDAEKSPNILEGRTVSKHLPTRHMVEAAKEASGGGNSPLYWQNKRGFWPPFGITKTVFSKAILEKFKAMGKQVFTGRSLIIIGTFDPAFGGGDRPVLRFAKLGEIQGGQWGIESFPPIQIPIDSTSQEDVHYQLADSVKLASEKIMDGEEQHMCLPENFGLDATGEGGGLFNIMRRHWGQIMAIEFGGAASDDSCSLEDRRPASEVYENKRVEMHFRAKNAVESGQLKGIDPIAAEEATQLLFEDMRNDGTTAKRIKLQSKKEYKALYKKSPDYSDSLVMLLEVARRKGFRLAPQGKTQEVQEKSSEIFEHAQAVYDEGSLYESEVVELEPA